MVAELHTHLKSRRHYVVALKYRKRVARARGRLGWLCGVDSGLWQCYCTMCAIVNHHEGDTPKEYIQHAINYILP